MKKVRGKKAPDAKKTHDVKKLTGKKPSVGKKPSAGKKKLAGKKSSVSKRPQTGKKSGKTAVFGIRNKIIICFLVPILFMIMLGIMSYSKAESGMSDSFRDSTQQTINMATEYIDMSNSFVEAEALKYVTDSDLGKYFVGIYDNDPTTKRTLIDQVKTQILAAQVGNSFISNIYIITESDRQMISTKTKAQSGIYEDYMAEMKTG